MTIKSIRKEKGLLAKKIAELLNISYRQYHRIENGEVKIDDSKVNILANAFNVSELDIRNAWEKGAV